MSNNVIRFPSQPVPAITDTPPAARPYSLDCHQSEARGNVLIDGCIPFDIFTAMLQMLQERFPETA